MEEVNATLDIGTNTILLLIAEGIPPHLKILRDEARIARLGEGLHQKPLFLPEAQERAFHVLTEYRHLCDQFGVQRIAAVGTAAFRKAKNAADFIQRVEEKLNITIRVISGDEEARLSYLSVERDFGVAYRNLVALDIGGGSTEIISHSHRDSLDLGTVVLTERYLKHDPPLLEEMVALKNEIHFRLSSSLLLRRGDGGDFTLIGLAGTVTTLSAIKQKLIVWDGSKVQGSILTQDDLEGMLPLFQKTTNKERRTIPGMVAGREDTILAGTTILKGVMEQLKTDRVIVSDRGLRFGLFYDAFGRVTTNRR